MENTVINDIKLSQHFTLAEFCNLKKYPDNKPTVQQIANLIYGCRQLLEPAREDPAQFQHLVDFLKTHALTDQLLTGNGWLHIFWAPFRPPRHYVRIDYYK